MSDIILVTGGAGFIGSNLVRRLVAEGRRVRILDDFSSGREDNLRELAGKIEIFRGDCADWAVARAAVSGAKQVYHLAARPSVARSVEDPVGTCRVNIEGTLHCLAAARDARVERFVLFSSSSVYGDQPTLPKIESMRPDPMSPYAASKISAEHLARVFHANYGLATIALRPFNVYGPRQDPASQYAAVVPRFITSVLRDEPPTIYGDGEQTRDFTFVDDMVEAVLRAARDARTFGGAYNIAGGRQTSVNALLDAVNATCGTKVEARHEPARVGDVKHSLADISAAKAALGWAPAVPLEEGLRRTVEWYRGPG
ncbi:MAG: SDR family oxidoreductase [Planctomycetes bacterium]|nr:SDR family oxidoreductase [Planctomycetota bacterium]